MDEHMSLQRLIPVTHIHCLRTSEQRRPERFAGGVFLVTSEPCRLAILPRVDPDEIGVQLNF
jgi:hypothetical protein